MASKQFSAVCLSSFSRNNLTTSAIGFDGVERSVRRTSSTFLLPEAETTKPLGRVSDKGGGRIGGILEGGFLGGVGRLERISGDGAGTGKGTDES